MAPCRGTSCYYGYESILSTPTDGISGMYRTFIEISAFAIFLIGVALNTSILTTLISTFNTLDTFDGFLINLSFAELVSSFGLPFLFFVEYTTAMAPIGDHGCQFIQWLNVTSVTITTTSILAATYDIYSRIYYGNVSQPMSRLKMQMFILLAWVVASVPGIPYVITGRMSDSNVCVTTRWSHDSEVFYISSLFIIQILLPVALLVFFFVRIFIVLRVPREGDLTLVDETGPGSEASFQRAVLKRQVWLLFVIAMLYFTIMLVFSLIGLALALNLDNIESNKIKYARLRELNSLFECLKCVLVPVVYFKYYDKLRKRLQRMCCMKNSNQELYNALNLRYNVYQQTVHDTNNSESNDKRASSIVTDDVFEMERDDVAIISNAS